MAEYIEREKAIECIRNYAFDVYGADLDEAQQPFTDDVTTSNFCEGLYEATEEVANTPVADVVSKSVYDQVLWERDLAVSQLEELGLSLGEKPDGKMRTESYGEWQTTKRHLWYKSKDGTPDTFAYVSCSCNGVECRKCGMHICVHCHPDWENNDDECYREHYVCSCCEYETLEITAYCPNCGAKMDGKDGE